MYRVGCFRSSQKFQFNLPKFFNSISTILSWCPLAWHGKRLLHHPKRYPKPEPGKQSAPVTTKMSSGRFEQTVAEGCQVRRAAGNQTVISSSQTGTATRSLTGSPLVAAGNDAVVMPLHVISTIWVEDTLSQWFQLLSLFSSLVFPSFPLLLFCLCLFPSSPLLS